MFNFRNRFYKLVKVIGDVIVIESEMHRIVNRGERTVGIGVSVNSLVVGEYHKNNLHFKFQKCIFL